MPRVLHVSDTHLGFQAYTRTTPDGLNQREVDVQDAFRRVVDAAVEDPPDVFLHTGDLFDHPRPNNRAIAFALQQIRRLSEARVPTVLVSGNHDAPRLRETGSIFRVFEGLSHVHPVYRGEPETLHVGGLTLHAVPQAITQEAFQAQLGRVEPTGPGPHVLAVHGTVLGVAGLYTSEFNDYQIPLGLLRPDLDYVALGHFHNTKRVADHAHYAGSTESFSFNEADQEKAFLLVDVGALQVAPRSVGARPMNDLGTVPASGLEPGALFEAVADVLRRAPKGAIARVTVDDVERDVARAVDWDALRLLRADLCQTEVRVRARADAHSVDGAVELGPVAQEFDAFFARFPLPAADRDRVRAEALACLAQAGGPTGAA